MKITIDTDNLEDLEFWEVGDILSSTMFELYHRGIKSKSFSYFETHVEIMTDYMRNLKKLCEIE